MPTRAVTRQSCRQLPRFKKHASVAQQVAALRRVIHWGESFRDATAYVNAQSGRLSDESIVTRSSLHRLHQSLPVHLRDPLLATEGALLAFIQERQSEQRAALSSGHALLTDLEEELLVQWLGAMAEINLPLIWSK